MTDQVRPQREVMARISAAGPVDPTIWKAVSNNSAVITRQGALGDRDPIRQAMGPTAD